MGLLSQVIMNTTQRPPKGIVSGPPGCGKTTFGASAKGSIIIDCENGAGAIQCRRTPYLETWQEIDGWLQALLTEKHDHSVVVIDTLDWMMRRAEEFVAGTSREKISATMNKSHGGYGNGKQVLRNVAYQVILPTLDKLVNRGLAVILLSHLSQTDITDADGVTTVKATPDLPPEYLNTFVEWSDFVSCVTYANDGSRVMVMRETGKTLAKNRYNMPERIPFEWGAFIAAMGIKPKAEPKPETKNNGAPKQTATAKA